jgi:5-methylcytosine-specific restriction endonuclease McrA
MLNKLKHEIARTLLKLSKRIDDKPVYNVYQQGFDRGEAEATAKLERKVKKEKKRRRYEAKRKRSKLSTAKKKRVLREAGYTCHYCGEFGGKLTVDHLVPIAKGGSNELSNLVAACEECNKDKGSLRHTEYML